MKYLYLFLITGFVFAAGWFGRGLLDGSLISRSAAAVLTTKAVTQAIADKEKRDAQQPKIAASITATQNAARIVPSASCKPGTGALSTDAADSMRDAFKPARN